MRHISFLFFGLLASAVSITGCATNKSSSDSTTGFEAVACPPDKALVYLYRVFRWHPDGNGITMCVNDTPVVALHGREYCPLVLEPGFVSFSHQFKQGPYGIPAITERIKDLQLQLQPGQTYYVVYKFVSPFHRPDPTMVLVDEATATNEMSICSMRKPMPNQAQPTSSGASVHNLHLSSGLAELSR